MCDEPDIYVVLYERVRASRKREGEMIGILRITSVYAGLCSTFCGVRPCTPCSLTAGGGHSADSDIPCLADCGINATEMPARQRNVPAVMDDAKRNDCSSIGVLVATTCLA